MAGDDASAWVEVYYNLNSHRWSIRGRQGSMRGLVVAHADRVVLTEVTPWVSQRGRERVVERGQRDVHATLRGYLIAADGERTPRSVAADWPLPPAQPALSRINPLPRPYRVRYNPYLWSTFMCAEPAGTPVREPFTGAGCALFSLAGRVDVIDPEAARAVLHDLFSRSLQ